MVKVESDVPLYVNGEVVTEFETTEAHLKDLQRLHGDKVRAANAKEPAPPADKPARNAKG